MLTQAVVDEWLDDYRARVLRAFGQRVVYIGCEGSWARGEGRPDSDIDAVTVLDRVETADLVTYRGIIDAMPHAEQACGLFRSVQELKHHEPRCERLHLHYSSKALYGTMSGVIDPPDRADLIAEIRMRMGNSLHAARHYLLFPHDIAAKVHNLRSEYKYAPVTLRWWVLLTTGVYHTKTGDLASTLAEPVDTEIARIAANWDGLTQDRATRPQYYIELLERWARDLLGRVAALPAAS